MRQVRHAIFAKACDDFDAKTPRIKRAGQQPDLRFLASDHEPPEDEEDSSGDCFWGSAHGSTSKTIWRKSRRHWTRSEMKAGASSNGTISVIIFFRMSSPWARSRFTVSRASRSRFHAKPRPRGTRLICAQRIASPL